MARNRQKARERREARLAEQQAGGAPADGAPADGAAAPDDGAGELAGAGGGLGPPGIGDEQSAELAANAPPEEIGRSDAAINADAPPQFADPDLAPEAAASRGQLGADGGPGKDRGRVTAFLVAVWAELQRVQWPNRKALTSLTAVVLGFVVLAGGYLGLLDLIFSRLIQALL